MTLTPSHPTSRMRTTSTTATRLRRRRPPPRSPGRARSLRRLRPWLRWPLTIMLRPVRRPAALQAEKLPWQQWTAKKHPQFRSRPRRRRPGRRPTCRLPGSHRARHQQDRLLQGCRQGTHHQGTLRRADRLRCICLPDTLRRRGTRHPGTRCQGIRRRGITQRRTDGRRRHTVSHRGALRGRLVRRRLVGRRTTALRQQARTLTGPSGSRLARPAPLKQRLLPTLELRQAPPLQAATRHRCISSLLRLGVLRRPSWRPRGRRRTGTETAAGDAARANAPARRSARGASRCLGRPRRLRPPALAADAR